MLPKANGDALKGWKMTSLQIYIYIWYLYVDVYVFVWSKEISDVLPTLRLGISEMMGAFHAQSDEELQRLATIQYSCSARERKRE